MILLALLMIPFAAGALSALAPSRRAMELLNLAAFAATFAIAVALAGEVLAGGPVSFWRGFLYADALSALVSLLTASVALICAVYAVGYLRKEESSGELDDNVLGQHRKYYSLTPLFVASMLLVGVTNNLGVMWVAIEATTLASVFLVTFYGKATSLEAAWKYAIIGGVGLSMALFGTVVAYYSAHLLPGGETLAGLNWSVLASQAARLDPTAMRLAFILVLLGYGAKAGLAPMHTWKPDAYSEAPVPSAAILSTAMLNCALYGLIRFYVLASRCLGPEFPGRLLLLLGLLSLGVAVPFILLQKNFRRLLAYSSIDQAGIMAIALGLGGPLGALALMLHMTYHTVAKSLLFLSAGNVYQHYKTDLFAKVKGGILQTMPITGAVFLLAMLAVAGMPPFPLFQSEFLIVKTALASGDYLTTALFVLFGAGIFAGLLVRVGGLVLGADGDTPQAPIDPWRHLPLVTLAAALVMLAFYLPRPLLDLIRGAAQVVGGAQ